MQRSLKFFPIQFFTVIMGVSGLSIVYLKACYFFHFPKLIYILLESIDILLFFFISTAYVIKLIKYPQYVRNEFLHPIKNPFFASLSISLMLIATILYKENHLISFFFWIIAIILHTFFTFSSLKFWIIHSFDIKTVNPAWFLPIVGNVIIPIVGIHFIDIYVNVFFFSIGIFYWIIFFSIITYRIIFHNPLEDKLIPTLFILLAPPAVGFISYFAINRGHIDMFGLFLYMIALFIFLHLLFIIKVFKNLSFFISWWGYTFPLDALSVATMLMYNVFHTTLLYILSLIFIVISSIVVFYVFYKTLMAVKLGKICISD